MYLGSISLFVSEVGREGNWDELTSQRLLGQLSGTRRSWPIADRRVGNNDPRNNCWTHLGSIHLLVSEVANLRLIPPIVHTPHLRSPTKPTAEQCKEGYYNYVFGYEKYLFQKCVHISLFSGGLILNCVRIGSLWFTCLKASKALGSLSHSNSNRIFPAFTLATWWSNLPLPFPIRLPKGFFVTGMCALIM